jgi:hypothetical protein
MGMEWQNIIAGFKANGEDGRATDVHNWGHHVCVTITIIFVVEVAKGEI